MNERDKQLKVYRFWEHARLEGRAVIDGTTEHPNVWLAKFSGHFCVNFANHDELLWVPPNAIMSAVIDCALLFDRLIPKGRPHHGA